jgi:hypothetical protein
VQVYNLRRSRTGTSGSSGELHLPEPPRSLEQEVWDLLMKKQYHLDPLSGNVPVLNMDNAAAMARSMLHPEDDNTQVGQDSDDGQDPNDLCPGRSLQLSNADFDIEPGDGAGSAISDCDTLSDPNDHDSGGEVGDGDERLGEGLGQHVTGRSADIVEPSALGPASSAGMEESREEAARMSKPVPDSQVRVNVSDVGSQQCVRGVHLGGRNQMNRTGRDQVGPASAANGGVSKPEVAGGGPGVRVDQVRKRGRPRKGDGRTQSDNHIGAFERAVSQMLESRSSWGASALELRQAESEARSKELRVITDALTAMIQRMGTGDTTGSESVSSTPEK